jgi:hypothetical protein
MAAWAPAAVSAKVELALPVTEVSSPIVIELAVTPGALAVLAAVLPPEAAVVPVLPAVVGGVLDLDELPHPATTSPATPNKATT